MDFGSVTHNEALQLVIQVAILLATARLLGGLAQKLGQPSVVGEILAGVILGPSLLSRFVPWVSEWVLPQTETESHMLGVVTLIGVMFLLVVTGLETDLALIKRRARVAGGIALGGLIVPFALGLALGLSLPESLLADPGDRTVFALFVATALSISAIPVLAKILIDLDLMRREFGQTMLSAGMIDDLTGWTMLGIVTALATAETLTAGTILWTIGAVVVFVAATATVGVWLTSSGLTLVQNNFRGQDMILTLVVVMAFAWGAFTQALHLEPMIGAFAVGILFGRLPRLPSGVAQKMESMALAVFAPIFFAVTGLKVDLGAILQPDLILLTLLVIVVATIGKVAGAYAGARWLSGQDHWSALAYGSGLNARGAVEIIIASIGLSLGLLTGEMFSIIVVMALVTSLAAPVALRYCLARVEPPDEEQQRLSKERAIKEGFTGNIQRVLVPVRPRSELAPTQQIQATLMGRLSQNRLSTTLLAVSSAADRRFASSYLKTLRDLFGAANTVTRMRTSDDPVATILAEAEGDYDLLVVGAPTMSDSSEYLFGPTIDDLVRLARCPTLVVRGWDVPDGWSPRRIVVPTNGTAAAVNAANLALTLSDYDTDLIAVHVVTPSLVGASEREDLGEDITAEFEKVGHMFDQQVTTSVRQSSRVEIGIMEEIERAGADLLVLGTNVRAGTTRLHLGPRVEYLAHHAPCPVLILNT